MERLDTHELFFDDVRGARDEPGGERAEGTPSSLRILDEGRSPSRPGGGRPRAASTRVSATPTVDRPSVAHGSNQSTPSRSPTCPAHVGRLAYYEAGARLLAGRAVHHQAAIAKLVATEDAVTNAREATQTSVVTDS